MARWDNSLCFDCQNAVCGCSWSKRFEPVDGWTATPVKIRSEQKRYIDSYVVKKCPLFVPDDTWNFIERFCQSHGITRRTFYRWKNAGKIKTRGYLYENSDGI